MTKGLLLVALMALLMPQDPQRQSGTIEGVINRAGTNFPIAGAQINASTVTTGNSNPTPFAETVSDGAGRFAFREMPPGSYVIEISLDGYFFGVPPGLNAKATARLVVAPGQRAQLQFPGVQAATLRGHVVNAEGKALPDMIVEILQMTNTQGPGRQVLELRTRPGIRTDDQGGYEKTMLVPGPYMVRTIVNRPDTPQAWVYFPGTTDPNSAKPVELREGTETTADIQVGPSIDIDTYRISGTVRLPVEDGPAVVLILRRRPDLSSSRLFTSEGNPRTFTESQARTGKFEFRGVRKGTYELYASASIAGKEYLDKSIVEVRGIDVEDVELVLRPGVDIKGRLVFDGEPRDLQLARTFSDDSRDENRSHAGDVKVLLNRQDGLFSESVFRPVIDDNGMSFTFPDVPQGDYEIAVSFVPDGKPPSPDLHVVDIRAAGRSVFDNGFQVGVDPVDAIEVIVGTQGGSIKGTVQGRPPGAPGMLMLVPDPFRTSNAPYRQVPVGIKAGNEFEVRGLRPGAYKLFAVPGLGTGLDQSGAPIVLYLEPEFYLLFESQAVRVLVEKEKTTGGVQVPFVPK